MKTFVSCVFCRTMVKFVLDDPSGLLIDWIFMFNLFLAAWGQQVVSLILPGF